MVKIFTIGADEDKRQAASADGIMYKPMQGYGLSILFPPHTYRDCTFLIAYHRDAGVSTDADLAALNDYLFEITDNSFFYNTQEEVTTAFRKKLPDVVLIEEDNPPRNKRP